jgi:GNAT superfamily N-acetyltransferase
MGSESIEIAPLQARDRAAWEVLARGYKDFYRTTLPDEVYEETWQRLLRGKEVHGIGAYLGGELVGIAHYLFHANPWMTDVCYLQDLFVAETLRGKGIARALIERVAKIAGERGASKLYWQTQEINGRARALYDKIGQYKGFIRYDFGPVRKES